LLPELCGLRQFMLALTDGAQEERRCLERHGFRHVPTEAILSTSPDQLRAALDACRQCDSADSADSGALRVFIDSPFYAAAATAPATAPRPPYHAIRRRLLQAGYQVAGCAELVGCSTDAGCIAGHSAAFLGMELVPARLQESATAATVTLLIKACYMEHATIRHQVRRGAASSPSCRKPEYGNTSSISAVFTFCFSHPRRRHEKQSSARRDFVNTNQ